MATEISRDLFAKMLLSILDETFDKVAGIFLDRGTSLFETLNDIKAEEASRPIFSGGTTIAAHTEHIRFYMQILEDYMQGQWHDKVDWNESWKIRSVTTSEWASLRGRLRETTDRVLETIKGFDDWNNENRLGGALGILTHTAYHLGAIRQIFSAIKG